MNYTTRFVRRFRALPASRRQLRSWLPRLHRDRQVSRQVWVAGALLRVCCWQSGHPTDQGHGTTGAVGPRRHREGHGIAELRKRPRRERHGGLPPPQRPGTDCPTRNRGGTLLADLETTPLARTPESGVRHCVDPAPVTSNRHRFVSQDHQSSTLQRASRQAPARNAVTWPRPRIPTTAPGQAEDPASLRGSQALVRTLSWRSGGVVATGRRGGSGIPVLGIAVLGITVGPAGWLSPPPPPRRPALAVPPSAAAPARGGLSATLRPWPWRPSTPPRSPPVSRRPTPLGSPRRPPGRRWRGGGLPSTAPALPEPWRQSVPGAGGWLGIGSAEKRAPSTVRKCRPVNLCSAGRGWKLLGRESTSDH